ncbi:MAG: hypothetical protein U1E33_08770 [Rhodospirillales bacterium]
MLMRRDAATAEQGAARRETQVEAVRCARRKAAAEETAGEVGSPDCRMRRAQFNQQASAGREAAVREAERLGNGAGIANADHPDDVGLLPGGIGAVRVKNRQAGHAGAHEPGQRLAIDDADDQQAVVRAEAGGLRQTFERELCRSWLCHRCKGRSRGRKGGNGAVVGIHGHLPRWFGTGADVVEGGVKKRDGLQCTCIKIA